MLEFDDFTDEMDMMNNNMSKFTMVENKRSQLSNKRYI